MGLLKKFYYRRCIATSLQITKTLNKFLTGLHLKDYNILLYPYFLYFICFMLLPIIIMVIFSLKKRDIYGGVILDIWDYSAWLKIFESQILYILLKSIVISISVTLLCNIIAYLIIIYLSTKKSTTQQLVIMLFLIPALMDIVVKVTGYMIFFGGKGIFNDLLLFLGLISTRLNFFFSIPAIIVGFIIQYIPYSLAFLWVSISKIDKSFIQSAKDLGSTDNQVFFYIMLPFSKKALLMSSIFIFTSSITNSSIPELIGGIQNLFASKLIISQFFEMSNWSLGSAIALVLFFTSIIFTITVNKLINRFL